MKNIVIYNKENGKFKCIRFARACWIALLLSYILLVFLFLLIIKYNSLTFDWLKIVQKVTYISIPIVLILFVFVFIDMHNGDKVRLWVKIPLLVLTMPVILSVIFVVLGEFVVQPVYNLITGTG